MADRLTAKLVGTAELKRALDRLDPSQQTRAMSDALEESALLTLRIAAREKILPGGRGKPRAKILTSRTNLLTGSLSKQGGGLNTRGLPRFIEAGTHLISGARHEFGKPPRRPFLAPALKDAQLRFVDIFLKHMRRAAKL